MMKNNFLAHVLLGVLGVLLLLASVQMVGLGQGLSEIEAEEFDPKKLNQLADMGSESGVNDKDKERQLEQIVALPLFSQTREPYVAIVVGPDPDSEGGVEVASPLDAKITSIVITGDNSYVMIHDNVSKERLTLVQGMPLEGEQGLWTVASIEPRKVTFEAEGEEPVELELEVFSGSLGKGSRGNNNKASSNKKSSNKKQSNKKQITATDKNSERANSAETIRKKIAERRAQMRKEAADRNQKQ